MNGENILRGVKPEAEISIDGIIYEVGGLKGQKNYAFLRPKEIDGLTADPSALQFTDYEVSEPKAPFEWKQVRRRAPDAVWPPKGVHLRLDFKAPDREIKVSVHYELYDGIPVMAKWLSLKNNTRETITIDDFTSEIIAAVEYGSVVEAREVYRS